ncbi:MAG: AMP-binding protein [Candidatus Nanopelagicales bacterium]
MHDTNFEGFYKRVENTPQRIAIYVEGQSITFENLLKEINRLGGQLLATRKKDQLDGILPLYVDRSLKSAVCIYAALWASIPFTVIDEETPFSMAQQLLARMQIDHPIWNVTEGDSKNTNQLELVDDIEPIKTGQPSDIAYVILTSGSTGVPKGVMTSRDNLARSKAVNWFDSAAEVDYGSMSVAPFAFAMGMYGLFRVSKGASYYNLKPKNYTPRQFLSAMKELGPTHVSLPAQLARIYSKSNVDIVIDSVQEVAIGGETIRLEQVSALLNIFPETTQVLHSLGASEAQSGLQWKKAKSEIEGSGPIPMTATPDASLFEPMPDYGEDVYEVWFGSNLSLGYFGNDELTNERFIEKNGRRWWKSGDLVKHVGNDQYTYFGRLDDVVKISGYLVSPMTITNALMTLPEVSQASVVSEKLDDSYVLHAFIELNPDNEVSREQIKIELAKLLPSYMIPKNIHIVDEIPLTVRGKTDVKNLRGLNSPTGSV